MPDYEPRPLRFAINERVELVRADNSTSKVTITNISQTGFGLQVANTPDIGEFVHLRGKAGDMPAQIRWALGNNAGGVFLRPRDDG